MYFPKYQRGRGVSNPTPLPTPSTVAHHIRTVRGCSVLRQFWHRCHVSNRRFVWHRTARRCGNFRSWLKSISRKSHIYVYADSVYINVAFYCSPPLANFSRKLPRRVGLNLIVLHLCTISYRALAHLCKGSCQRSWLRGCFALIVLTTLPSYFVCHLPLHREGSVRH